MSRLFETYSSKQKQEVKKEEPKIEIPKKKELNVFSESNIDGWISQYIPEAPTDRYVVYSPKGEKFACKFYNKDRNDFIGSSLLSMYNLNDHFDRNILPEEVNNGY